MTRTFLSGADLILSDRIASGLTVVLESDRIADIISGPRGVGDGETRVDLAGHFIAPGFIDVHVHGIDGVDVLDGAGSVAQVARALPRSGVTAFCPTSTACAPETLETFLTEVGALRISRPAGAARVLPAHLESNFINPEFRGAQPLACLRAPGHLHLIARGAPPPLARPAALEDSLSSGGLSFSEFSAAEILAAIERRRPDVGIITMAPELEGGFELLRHFVSIGLRVSLGHSGATFDLAQEAIAAGARHATHLFNAMPPLKHREPGLAGAVLAADDIAAEIICDGFHVHPAIMRMAIAAKGSGRVMAITDGTAGSGLARGSRTRLGGQSIVVEDVARLEDTTIAGSVLTMERAFATLVSKAGIDLVRAAEMCSTTPARELGLQGLGTIATGGIADLVVLTANLDVRQTWIGGMLTPAFQTEVFRVR